MCNNSTNKLVYCNLETMVLVKTVGGVILKASEDVLISNNLLKCGVTFKEYENSVYCNMAAVLHIFFLSNDIL